MKKTDFYCLAFFMMLIMFHYIDQSLSNHCNVEVKQVFKSKSKSSWNQNI